MDINLFDFELPEQLIAQVPLMNRSHSRLLTLNRNEQSIQHRQFHEIIDFLESGDTLVLNDTRVIPARLHGIKSDTGAKVEVLLLKSLGDDRWEALVRPGKRVKTGANITFNSDLHAVVEEEGEMGSRIIRFTYEGIFNEILDSLGEMPLPPYIKERLADRQRYQTVFAKHEGSAAAPTAGLHFTEELLQQIQDKGVRIAYVTLHVGLGTFRPVAVDDILKHEMHAEFYEISAQTAALINETRKSGKRIIAVGTTSARTLETVARRFEEQEIEACQGWTDIFIYPGIPLKIVDALLTNFHLPKSTLVMLVSAFAGREFVLKAYQEAIHHNYRFFSFGDAMFIY